MTAEIYTTIPSNITKSLPAEAKMVHMRAFFNAVILSSSATMVLYDSSLYLWAASMNLRR